MSVPLKAWLSLSVSSAHLLAHTAWARVDCKDREKELCSKNRSPTLQSKSLSLLRSAQSLRTAFSPPVCSSRSWWLVFGRSPAVILQFDGELLEEEIERSPCQLAFSGLQGKQRCKLLFQPKSPAFCWACHCHNYLLFSFGGVCHGADEISNGGAALSWGMEDLCHPGRRGQDQGPSFSSSASSRLLSWLRVLSGYDLTLSDRISTSVIIHKAQNVCQMQVYCVGDPSSSC